MFRRNGIGVFSNGSISEKFNEKYESALSVINSEPENYILNVNVTEYLDHLHNTYKLDPPIIHFDQVHADSYEADVPAEYFPETFAVDEGKKYKKVIIQFFIPCSGDVGLLKYKHATRLFTIAGGDFEVCLDLK